MTDRTDQPAGPASPDRKPFTDGRGPSGQAYDLREEEKLGAQAPSGSVAAKPSRAAPDPATPPHAGHRASADPTTGEVRGSGAGAGAGSEGEQYDSDAAGGDGPAITGAGPDKPAD